MTVSIWIGVIALIIGLLVLDLVILNRGARMVCVKEALVWTMTWVVLALCFNVFVYFLYENNWLGWSDVASHDFSGQQAAVQFLTGFLMEKSLSIDNIFVIAMIFSYLKVPVVEQHRLLLWGVLGAIGLRVIMVTLGTVLMARFHWIVYLFGGLLIATAVRMMMIRQDNINIGHSPLLPLIKKFYPITDNYKDGNFFSTLNGNRAITPLLLALILVVSTNLMFALDSIPAIFAVTQDPFLVFTCNVFSVLGLRALYFTIAGYVDRFRYIKLSLVFVLVYFAAKMMLIHTYPIPNIVSLVTIGSILTLGVLASLWVPPLDVDRRAAPLFTDLVTLAVLSYRQARRIVVLVLGTSVLLVGVAMIVLPGPAVVVIPVGLGILAIEFAWARRWLRKMRQTAGEFRQRIRN
ncbi:Integral membrane protein TerC [Nitrosococcus halophilus Nc 4]|uniref:Integral membrane protein TerC n=1 Tax=Nitrosococcus halophilus (strain Nc4) TaxID=472759 RepID=D5C236_NITHN|nr:TerC/Alx family metal homeostasis membrane protein [Nitrosococcus halophilus]ADE16624.1 Integral membrane protein TerC [Nitrosococcus halophilus Nc 4]